MFWSTPVLCTCADLVKDDRDEPSAIEILNETGMKALSRQITPVLCELSRQISPKSPGLRAPGSEKGKSTDGEDGTPPNSPLRLPSRQISSSSMPRHRQLSDEYAMVPMLSSNASDCDILQTSDDHRVGFRDSDLASVHFFSPEAPMDDMIKTLSSGGGRKENVEKALEAEAVEFISRINNAKPGTFKIRGVLPSGFEWGAELGGATLTQITRGTILHTATHLTAANLDVSSPGGSALSQPSIFGLQKNLEAVKNLGPIADNKLDCLWQVTSTSLYTKLASKKLDEALRVSIIDMRTSIVILIRSAPPECARYGPILSPEELRERAEHNFIGVLLEPRAEGGVIETMLCQTAVPQAFRYLWRMTPSAALRRAFSKDVEQMLMGKKELAEFAAANDPAKSKSTVDLLGISTGKVKGRSSGSTSKERSSSKGSTSSTEGKDLCPNGHVVETKSDVSVQVACEVCKKFHAANNTKFCKKCGYRACNECHAFYVVWTGDRGGHKGKARDLDKLRLLSKNQQ